MRNALLSAAVLLALACAWWLARPAQRDAVVPMGPAGTVEEVDGPAESELAAPVALEVETENEASEAPDETGSPGTRAKVPAVKALDRAPVRGRLILSGTDIPIEAELPVRLRTVDLAVAESLTTRPDGTFTSTHHYRRGVLLALVKNAEGFELVDHEALFDPRAEEEWLVPVPASKYPTIVRGRVVDRRGQPIFLARVQLVPRRAQSAYVEQWSNEDGSFELVVPRPGPYRLHAQGHWTRSEPVELTLRTGPNDLGDVVVPEREGAGDLVVRVVGELGTTPPGAVVLLVDEAGRCEQAIELPERGWRENGAVELRIESVPAGRHSLALDSLDGRSYEPASIAVSPPAELEFRARGVPPDGLRLRARDASTGAPLTSFIVLASERGGWAIGEPRTIRAAKDGEVLLGPRFDGWILYASGHRAQRGTCDGSSTSTREVMLERGWSEILSFEDVEGDCIGLPFSRSAQRRTPVAGVEAWADGKALGESGSDGILIAEDENEPARLEFRLAGWRVVGEARRAEMRRVWLAQSP